MRNTDFRLKHERIPAPGDIFSDFMVWGGPDNLNPGWYLVDPGENVRGPWKGYDTVLRHWSVMFNPSRVDMGR